MNIVYERSKRKLKIGDSVKVRGYGVFEVIKHDGELCFEYEGQKIRLGHYSHTDLEYKGTKYKVCMIHHAIENVYLGTVLVKESEDFPEATQLIQDYFDDYIGDIENFVKNFCKEMGAKEVSYDHYSPIFPNQVYIG